MAYRKGHGAGKGQPRSRRSAKSGLPVPMSASAAPSAPRTLRVIGTAEQLAIAATVQLCDAVALLPLSLAWERAAPAMSVAMYLVVELTGYDATEQSRAIQDASQRMVDTLVSRRMAELGGVH